MADNVAITAGTGTTIATDERSIASTNVQIQRVDDIGGSTIATGQVTATTTAATLLAARETRKSVTFINRGSVDVYIGPATVTTANGIKLAAGDGLTVPTTALFQCIAASSTASVHYIEAYS